MVEELFRHDSYLKSCEAVVTAVDEKGIRLDRTVFYPTGGGQPGDRGTLTLADGTVLAITDTVKAEGDIAHVPAPGTPLPAVGTKVTGTLDWERRYRHMRMHTALHVMSAVIKGDVTGGQVTADKSRLDFNLGGEIPTKEDITAGINRLVALDSGVTSRWIADEELAARPELVKTMSVRPPSGTGSVRLLEIEGVDLQACGGTHVARTGEIGSVECVKVENKGKMNRRFIITLPE
jgi:misacylated tRNA(Ala) deacylase